MLSRVHNYVKAERFQSQARSYVHASIRIHCSGVSGHTVKHAEGSDHSHMHLPKNPAWTVSWTRLCCKKMGRLGAFSKDYICTDAQNCNLPHKRKKNMFLCSPGPSQSPVISRGVRGLWDCTQHLATVHFQCDTIAFGNLGNNHQSRVRSPPLGCNNYFSKIIITIWKFCSCHHVHMLAFKIAFPLCLIMNSVFFKSSDFCITHYTHTNAHNIP